MESRLDLQSQFLLLFFHSIRDSKDLFYFYFPFEEGYHDITFILPLNGYCAYIPIIFYSVPKVLSEIRLLTSCLHRSRSCTRNQKTNKIIRHIGQIDIENH